MERVGQQGRQPFDDTRPSHVMRVDPRGDDAAFVFECLEQNSVQCYCTTVKVWICNLDVMFR